MKVEKVGVIALSAVVCAAALAGCGGQDQQQVGREADDGSHDTQSEAPTTPAPSANNAHSRKPDEPILGNIGPNGACDESVIAIDHEKPTARITYHGQPGDHIKLTINSNSPEREAETQEFELSSTLTEMQIPTDIPNDTIPNIQVEADGRVGLAGNCVIEVN